MNAAAQPFMKFYPQDWRADEKLRMCSLAARGLWLEMLALMHRSERYGQLLISGHVPTDAQLAVQVGAPPSEVSALLAELESAGVFSRAAIGAIYSRRMTRDAKKAKIARQNGKTGGNPSLRKQTENSGSVKGVDKPQVKGGDKPQIPDTRYQSSDTDVSGAKPPDDPVKALFDLGVAVLTNAGHAERQARALIGKWRKAHGDAATSEAVLSAKEKTDPLTWIEASLARRKSDSDDFFAGIDRKYAGLKPVEAMIR
jgi:hypothetical protein